jgi:hypothetical protein
MVEVVIPKTIKVGGFDYTIEMTPAHDAELRDNKNYGECSNQLKRIRICSDCQGQQFSETFIHEIVHAIDNVFGHNTLTEDQVHALGNGFLQVFEQLGINLTLPKEV